MLSRANRAYLRASGPISRVAMAKVEGSNPFIRFYQNPRISGGFVHLASEEPLPARIVGTTRGYQTPRYVACLSHS
jgi:hypothetical protein